MIRDIDSITAFEQSCKDVLYPVLYGLFNQFSLLQQHYAACDAVATWVESASTIVREVWTHPQLQLKGKNG